MTEVTEKMGEMKLAEGGGKGGGSGGGKTEKAPPRDWTPEMEADYQRILSVGEECISASELKGLISAKGRGTDLGFNLYDGFEPSGRMHIAQGVFKAMNVNKCTFPGTNSTFIFWVADWFALMNDKMGGDLDKIKTVGAYLIEVWKAAGMDLTNVVFKWCSEEITNKADLYWPKMLDIARRFNITRIKKCCQIMGRLEGSLTSAQILYPLMQCTDIFFLKADICQLGVDQRKVNMLAREYCEAAKMKNKPIILSHHMLYGLKAGQEKMSKSDPDSAVFMEDSAEDVERKIMNAYCPTREEERPDDKNDDSEDAGKASLHLVEDKVKNPCLDYIKNIIFSPPDVSFTAGGKTYTDFETVRDEFLGGELSEEDLKKGLIDALNTLLEPVRAHFSTDETAKGLLAKVSQYKKETLPKDSKIRRLNLVELSKVPAGSHLVFAPDPNVTPTLQEAVDVLVSLQQAKESQQCVLMLLDWSARVINACDADIKSIAAYYSILLTSLRALDPDTMDKVQVIYQSEAILADPSNYWISVINVGRHFMLNDVMGPNMKDSEGVGNVIARLMKVADVAGVEPASVALLGDDSSKTVETKLITEFFSEKLPGLTQPSVSSGNGPSLLLQERELEAHKTENDEYYLLDDPKVHGKAKMKKAFCEPMNISFCPPINVASAFAFGLNPVDGTGELTISRSAENGGDVVFKTRSELEASFADESLHPGDLKAAASTLMVSTLEKLSAGIKADGDATKATKTLKAAAKKLAKKK
ncbi:tyrosyl-tRNA synthetase [Nitzschia inconspicua]|uniref:tyrosine--tRNA ligase n=1 Tax=Nitzschia inconspicua TaxID=303405 RepID=A0A9K3LPZ2_9STRA|nr:tyrosyl-tRNA synthetase [Nitzschia inconspicua]